MCNSWHSHSFVFQTFFFNKPLEFMAADLIFNSRSSNLTDNSKSTSFTANNNNQ